MLLNLCSNVNDLSTSPFRTYSGGLQQPDSHGTYEGIAVLSTLLAYE